MAKPCHQKLSTVLCPAHLLCLFVECKFFFVEATEVCDMNIWLDSESELYFEPLFLVTSYILYNTRIIIDLTLSKSFFKQQTANPEYFFAMSLRCDVVSLRDPFWVILSNLKSIKLSDLYVGLLSYCVLILAVLGEISWKVKHFKKHTVGSYSLRSIFIYSQEDGYVIFLARCKSLLNDYWLDLVLSLVNSGNSSSPLPIYNECVHTWCHTVLKSDRDQAIYPLSFCLLGRLSRYCVSCALCV